MPFFSDPVMDMQITIVLLVISAIVSAVMYAVSKNVRRSLTIFSVLANVSFLVNIGSLMFLSYGLVWLQYITISIWPLINIFLLIRYFKKNEGN